ncbi:MAG: hypothetical protein A3K19_10630 [Lentisphaerae bacterium RIFOXYB12_FULL_65_16]|nr:MAG: hypothetical protein A3K18_05290 [Lentisphaerae bacterium RIFOXYA12_64_32]OGV87908.1 MAG: hypothetical protein A3K19_10630 [Lentisphaerae bacterium RIFOXYB12_FULL_65_16]
MPAELLLAKIAPKTLAPVDSIGAKWLRLLDRLDLGAAVKGKRTAIKMHLGGGVGFGTVHPFLVRKLVEKVKAAGAKQVFVTDGPGDVAVAVERGYTAEVLGCPVISATGADDRYFYKRPIAPPFKTLKSVDLAGEIVDAEALIDLAHIKGHGACGFGGASKNLSMGCVTTPTRRNLHALEGGMEWTKEKCSRCRICMENCPNHAIRFSNKGEFSVFYHNCKFCQHCVLICPKKAIKMIGGAYKDFQHGMALTTSQVLKCFKPENVVFINVLTNITIYCDCWGMSGQSLVPDIGFLAGRDIVAIETASLDLIRTKDLIPGTLPPGMKLGKKGHLFERLHSKDPYVVVDDLAKLGHGAKDYTLTEVE